MDLATIFDCKPSKLNWILLSDLFHSFFLSSLAEEAHNSHFKVKLAIPQSSLGTSCEKQEEKKVENSSNGKLLMVVLSLQKLPQREVLPAGILDPEVKS